MKFRWRQPNGQIVALEGENATASLNNIGTPLSWDDCLNTVDVKKPSGTIIKMKLEGAA
jgi:hypothetical protein